MICVLVFSIWSKAEASPYCNQTLCLCPSSFNYNNACCVDLCPTGFAENAGVCIKSGNLGDYEVSFNQYWNFAKEEIGIFSLKPNNFKDINNSLPVPTKDRGFYFKSSSKLISKSSIILSPDFTVRLVFKVSKDGIIMKSESNGTENFKVYVKNSTLCLSVLMTQYIDKSTLNVTNPISRRMEEDENDIKENEIIKTSINHQYRNTKEKESKFLFNNENEEKFESRYLEKSSDMLKTGLEKFQPETDILDLHINSNNKNLYRNKSTQENLHESALLENQEYPIPRKVQVFSLSEELNNKYQERFLLNDTNGSNLTNSNSTETNPVAANSTNSTIADQNTSNPDTTNQNSTDQNTTNPNSTNQNSSTPSIEWVKVKQIQEFCVQFSYDFWYIATLSTLSGYSDLIIRITISKHISSFYFGPTVQTNKTFTDMQFLEQKNFEVTTVGSSEGSFNGFIYQMGFFNHYDQIYFVFIDIVECDYPLYYDYDTKSCRNCTGSNLDALCTSENGYCYSAKCSSCTGFIYKTCNECYDNSTAPDCGGSSFTMLNCSDPLILYKSLCVYPSSFPSIDVSLPAITIKFDKFEQFYGGIFQSGHDNSTYGPFWNPEYDDPIPIKKRGLYFNGVSYLKSSGLISLNTEFSIGIWHKRFVNNPIWSSPFLTIYSSSITKFCLYSGFDHYCTVTKLSTDYKFWIYTIISLKYDEVEKSTELSRIVGQTNSIDSYVEGFYFLNEPQTVKIGIDAFGNFNGLIYKIVIWNNYIVNVNPYTDEICGQPSIGCLWEGALNTYYNEYLDGYEYCRSGCNKGCSTWGTCNICHEVQCDLCNDYETCSGNMTKVCSKDLHLSSQKSCCHTSCKECFEKNYYSCLSCFNNFFLLGSVCVVTCPLGYQKINGNCTVNTKDMIKIVFDSQDRVFTDDINSITFMSGGSFYPNFNQSSVIPSVQRGVYFTATSFIYSDPFIMNYNFSLIFYIKPLGTGILFTKGDNQFHLGSPRSNLQRKSASFLYGTINFGSWIRLLLKSQSSFRAFLTSCLYIENIGYCAYSYYLELDNNSPLILGNNLSSFTGFIYSFSVSNSYLSVSDYGALLAICTDSTELNCLSDCQFGSYPSGQLCSNCPNCPYGCISSSDCNLCSSNLCGGCDLPGGPCTSCAETYTLSNGVCACVDRETIGTSGNCEKCDFECKSCEGLTGNCSLCGNGTELVNGTCFCMQGAVKDIEFLDYLQCICLDSRFWNNDTCDACHEYCLTCKGGKVSDCLSCNFYIDNGICVEGCSLGYEVKDGVCFKASETSLIFDLVFNSKQLPSEDNANKISVSYKSGSSRLLQNSGSYSIIHRGIYLDGLDDFIEIPSSPLNYPILNYQFCISLWIYCARMSASLIQQSINSVVGFDLFIDNSQIVFLYPTGEILNKIGSINIIEKNKWINIKVLVYYLDGMIVELSVNDVVTGKQLFSYLPFVEKTGSSFEFGEGSNRNFQGFLHSIKIFNEAINLGDIIDDIIICEKGLGTNLCLTSCPVSQFYNEIDGTCYDCGSDCSFGCRTNLSCSQCLDPYCEKCDDFYSTCQECFYTHILQNGVCQPCGKSKVSINNKCTSCKSSEYFDPAIGICSECPAFCFSCESSSVCNSCVKNAVMTEDNLCTCFRQSKIANICENPSTYFHAIISVSFSNYISLQFTENLATKLEIINITLQNVSLNFIINEVSVNLFELLINYPENIVKNSKLLIFFEPNLTSVNGSLIEPAFISVILFEKLLISTNKVAQAEELATKGVSYGVSVAFGTSLLSLDPSSFFSFISTAETLYPISLFSFDQPDELRSFFSGARVQKSSPNLFDYFLSSAEGNKLHENFRNLGYKTNLVLLNAGVNLTVGLVFFTIMILLKLINRIEIIKPFIKGLKKKFEYGIFIRYWVQSFLELLFGALISLRYNNLSNPIEVFDYFIAILIMVLFI